MRHNSKKNKSSWRKNIDISDIDKFLEEQREEERVGGVEQKLDSELFLTDDAVFSKSNLILNRKKKFQTLPKFCSSLENKSNVDPFAKHNVKKHVYSSKHCKMLGTNMNKSIKTSGADVWESQVPIENSNEWLNDAIVKHNNLTGKPLIKAFPSKKKQTAIANVEIPQPGASYNPSLNDYNDLKMSVISKEKEMNKINKHYDRVITSKFTKMSKEDRAAMIWNEMTEGLLDNTEKQNSPENEYDGVYKAINPPVVNKKKERKTKNKKQRAIIKRNNDIIIKTELKKCSDIERINKFNSDLNNREAAIMRKQESRVKRLKEKQLKPPRVSYLKFEESEADFAEPTELADTLRTIAPNKSLIVDRFKSFQKRALIAPKKHRDGILRNNKSYLKRWKRYIKADHKNNNELNDKTM